MMSDGNFDQSKIPKQWFARQDESADELFYTQPRLLTHIDDATINEITAFYREVLTSTDCLLDLMSSWISHLPNDVTYQKISGLGMNQEELANNPRLDDCVVQNLNTHPTLPYLENAYDKVMIVVSIQYLNRPFEVFAEINRVLKPGGKCIVAMSHRLFPTKAIYAFHALSPADRCLLVTQYMKAAGLQQIDTIDRSPKNADPLWLVVGEKSS